MPDYTQTLVLLRDAKELISTPDRWVQGTSYIPMKAGVPGRHCMVGAICKAAKPEVNERDFGAVYSLASFFLERSTETPHISVWNDTPGRTHAEVMAAFDKAIEIAQTAAGFQRG